MAHKTNRVGAPKYCTGFYFHRDVWGMKLTSSGFIRRQLLAVLSHLVSTHINPLICLDFHLIVTDCCLLCLCLMSASKVFEASELVNKK